MDNRPIAVAIRSKKLGVLIQSARLASDKTIEDCAGATSISAQQLEDYEEGNSSPSLPELEALAFYLKIPIDYFWGREIITPSQDEPKVFEKDRLETLGWFSGAAVTAGDGLRTPHTLASRGGCAARGSAGYRWCLRCQRL